MEIISVLTREIFESTIEQALDDSVERQQAWLLCVLVPMDITANTRGINFNGLSNKNLG